MDVPSDSMKTWISSVARRISSLKWAVVAALSAHILTVKAQRPVADSSLGGQSSRKQGFYSVFFKTTAQKHEKQENSGIQKLRL